MTRHFRLFTTLAAICVLTSVRRRWRCSCSQRHPRRLGRHRPNSPNLCVAFDYPGATLARLLSARRQAAQHERAARVLTLPTTLLHPARCLRACRSVDPPEAERHSDAERQCSAGVALTVAGYSGKSHDSGIAQRNRSTAWPGVGDALRWHSRLVRQVLASWRATTERPSGVWHPEESATKLISFRSALATSCSTPSPGFIPLPPGLSLDPTSGVISGTPTAPASGS